MIELVLPFAWVCTPVNVVRTYLAWVKRGQLPSYHLAQAFLDFAVDEWGGINCAPGHRATVSASASLTKGMMLRASRAIRDQVHLMRSDNPPTHKSVIANFRENIHSCAEFGSHTILSLMATLGAVPAVYASEAVVCSGTKNFERLNKVFGIPVGSINLTYQLVSQDLGVPVLTCENSSCEMGRDLQRRLDPSLRDKIFIPGSRHDLHAAPELFNP